MRKGRKPRCEPSRVQMSQRFLDFSSPGLCWVQGVQLGVLHPTFFCSPLQSLDYTPHRYSESISSKFSSAGPHPFTLHRSLIKCIPHRVSSDMVVSVSLFDLIVEAPGWRMN